MTPFSLD